jgi:hypothetical protein
MRQGEAVISNNKTEKIDSLVKISLSDVELRNKIITHSQLLNAVTADDILEYARDKEVDTSLLGARDKITMIGFITEKLYPPRFTLLDFTSTGNQEALICEKYKELTECKAKAIIENNLPFKADKKK